MLNPSSRSFPSISVSTVPSPDVTGTRHRYPDPSTDRERLIRDRHAQLASCIAGRAFLVQYRTKIKLTIKREEAREYPDKEYLHYLWALRELVDARLRAVARIRNAVENAFHAAWWSGSVEDATRASRLLDDETWMWNRAHVGFVPPPKRRSGGSAWSSEVESDAVTVELIR